MKRMQDGCAAQDFTGLRGQLGIAALISFEGGNEIIVPV